MRFRALVINAFVALAIIFFAAGAQSSRNAKDKSAIQKAIAHLVEEANFAIREGKLHNEKSDYATRFTSEIPLRDLSEAVAGHVHAEPFIDAYVRWQLISLSPSLPDLDDRQFIALISNTPAMVVNPKADAAVISRFEHAESASGLSFDQIGELRLAKVELERRVAIADSFNRPAREFRNWLSDQFATSRMRQHSLVIEECAATIKSGWPPRSIKSKLTKIMKHLGDDSSISQAQRQFIAQQLRQLATIEKRRAINEITFSKGGVDVTYTNINVDQDDIEKWISQLNGDAP